MPVPPKRARAIAALAVVVTVLTTALPQHAGAITPPPDPTWGDTWGSTGVGNGQFDQPSSVAIGLDGTVYVADTGNHRIQRFNGATGAFLGAFGAGGPTPSTLSFPYGVSVDEAGDVWVADTFNARIKRFSPTGTWLQTFGAGGSGNGQLNLPFGVAVRDGKVYVADSFNHRIQQFTTAGAYVRQWGSNGSANGQFSQPHHIDINRTGEVFVADTYNHRVQVFSPTGTFLRKWGTSGDGHGEFGTIEALDVDEAGHVWAADTGNHRVQRFGPDGAFLGAFGTEGTDPDDMPNPFAIDVRGGRAVIASGSADKIVAFDLCGGGSFSDLTPTNPFFDAVCWGTAVNLVNGYPDGTFRGTNVVTRQAAAAYLYRLLDSPIGPFPDPGFSDLDSSNTFFPEISWLVDEGIASGYPDGTFRPTGAVSRQAMAAYLYAAAGEPVGPFPDPGFTDVPPTHPFFTQIAWLASTGITKGYADGGFHPAAPVSRQAMVQFLVEVDGRFLH